MIKLHSQHAIDVSYNKPISNSSRPEGRRQLLWNDSRMRSRMMFTFIQIWKREELYALENCSSEREIKWKGGWWAATVLKRSENRCRWPFFSVIPFLVVQFPIFAVKRTTASKKYCTPETSCRRIHPWGRIWKCTNPSPTPHSNLEMVWSNLENGLLIFWLFWILLIS